MISLLVSSLIGFVLIIFSVVIIYKNDWKGVWILLPPIILSVVLSEGWLNYMPVVISPLIIGAFAGYTFRHNRAIVFFILFSSLSLTVVYSTNYYFLKYYKNVDLLMHSKENVIKVVESSNIPQTEKKEFLRKLTESFSVIKNIIPFTYFLNSLIVSIFCFYLIKLFLLRYLGTYGRSSEGIELFKLNDYYIFTLIFGWLIVLLVDNKDYPITFSVGLNVALIISILYLVQAIGIVKYFIIKKGFPRFLLPLLFLIILLVGIRVFLFVVIILISIGAIDFWADFRKLGKTQENLK